MNAPSLRYHPTVLVSRDGERSIELVRFDGSEKIRNQDAIGYYFAVRSSPGAVLGRLRVIFDGLTRTLLKPRDVGIPESSDLQNFVHFSEVAVGEHLDKGQPLEVPGDDSISSIECFSNCWGEWDKLTPADEDSIEAYILARLFWSWRFSHDRVLFTVPDLLRLRVPYSRFLQVAELGNGNLWSIGQRNPFGAILIPTPQFLSAERARRKNRDTAQVQSVLRGTNSVFVDESRLEELRNISSPNHDLRRLLALCEELNICAANGCFHAVAMLTRAIIDHVPPIFGVNKFSEVASNYAGSKSFKESMEHLANSARKIADAHLHVQVRSKEVLPTRTQVDFSRDLDVLLSEIVRIL
jgi:hypothetical protein